jgi:hypothetical protein
MKSIISYSLFLIPLCSFAQWNNSGDNSTTGNLTIHGTYASYSNYGLILQPTSGDAIIKRGNAGNLMISSNGGTSEVRFNYNYGGGSGGIKIYDGGTTNHAGLVVNSSGHLSISASGGNVGIGTSNPLSRLDVYSNAILGSTAGNYALLNRFYSVSGDAGNYFNDNTWLYRDATGSDWLTARIHEGIAIDGSFAVPGLNTRTWWERDPFNDIQSFGNGSTAYFTIKEGNVGIGTINPQSLLSVKGIITSQEVNVTMSGWSDYVFDENYSPIPLSELEIFIKKNRHLPEVPTAKQVIEKGINLGETDALFLKKIEELTLYIIDMEKRIKKLEQENVELKLQKKRE